MVAPAPISTDPLENTRYAGVGDPKENGFTSLITIRLNTTPWHASLGATRAKLEAEGGDQLCQVAEDYRLTGPFDILASIGGLLAFLQGLHIFLFGRPLFWGMFG